MTLADLPDAVIGHLRAEASAVFGQRVAGTAAEARAAEQTELAVPHAFFMPGAVEVGEGEQLSPLDQHLTVRFRVMIAVDNASDERGQAGAAGLLAAVAAVARALTGWTPGAGFAPVLFDGLEDQFDNDRKRLWGVVAFRSATMLSNL